MAKLTIPLDIDLNTSNVAASTEAEYASTTTYATSQVVKVTYNDGTTVLNTPIKTYRSLQDANLNNYPDGSTAWLDLGATNRWAMFDKQGVTQTANTTNINVNIDAPNVTTFALFNLLANEIQYTYAQNRPLSFATSTTNVNFQNGGQFTWYVDSVTSTAISLLNRNTLTWSDYFFKEIFYDTQYVAYLSTGRSAATLDITITRTNSTAKCGQCLLGTWYSVGETLQGVTAEILDYSKRQTDANGNDSLTVGNWAKKVTAPVYITEGTYNALYRSMITVRATPMIIDLNEGSADYDLFRFFGYVSKFSPSLRSIQGNTYQLECKGLT